MGVLLEMADRWGKAPWEIEEEITEEWWEMYQEYRHFRPAPVVLMGDVKD